MTENEIELKLRLSGLAQTEAGIKRLLGGLDAIKTVVVGSAILNGLSRLSDFLTRIGGQSEGLTGLRGK